MKPGKIGDRVNVIGFDGVRVTSKPVGTVTGISPGGSPLVKWDESDRAFAWPWDALWLVSSTDAELDTFPLTMSDAESILIEYRGQEAQPGSIVFRLREFVERGARARRADELRRQIAELQTQLKELE